MLLLVGERSRTPFSFSLFFYAPPLHRAAGKRNPETVAPSPSAMNHILRIVGWFIRTPETPQGGAKLVSIPLSHYCEKIRWALDISPLRKTYIEEAHAPVFHIKPAISLTKKHNATSTPILVLSGSRASDPPTIIQGSETILAHLAETFPAELGLLYPPGEEGDRARALEQDLGNRLGPQSRKLVYWAMWQARQEGLSTANPFLDAHLPKAEAMLWNLGEGKILFKMMQVMDINAASVVTALDDCRQVFKEASAMLVGEGEGEGKGKQRKYLLGGERMTAADLTFAALAYPLIHPPAFASLGVSGPSASPWTTKLADVSAEFRATTAGQHVLRLYAEERFPAGEETSRLCLRTVDCNKMPWQ
jgi:glutathione S-transferase